MLSPEIHSLLESHLSAFTHLNLSWQTASATLTAVALTSTAITLNAHRDSSLKYSAGFSFPQDMTHLPALSDGDKVPVFSLDACALANTDSCLWLVQSGSSEFQSAGGLCRYSHTLLPRAPFSLASRRSFSLAMTDTWENNKRHRQEWNFFWGGEGRGGKWRY